MKLKKHILIIISLLSCFAIADAQVQITRSVIGTTGNNSTAGNISISSTTGEPAVTTLTNGNIILTQGFQQPSVAAKMTLLTTVIVEHASCSDVNDGSAIVEVSNGIPPYDYNWYNDAGIIVSSTLQSGSSDTTIIGLLPGTYTVFLMDANGDIGVDTAIIKSENTGCELHIFSGITPNSDGHNDIWLIEGLESFPDNEVFIFNRWGDEVWSKKNYNNKEIVWDGTHRNGSKLPNGTYYYVVRIFGGNNYKGWVQVTR